LIRVIGVNLRLISSGKPLFLQLFAVGGIWLQQFTHERRFADVR
jgi:hypothetical protein